MIINNNDGTVTDTNTNLMWQQELLGGFNIFNEYRKFSWNKANSLATLNTYLGYNDWRVPTLEELMCLVININFIDSKIFPFTPKESFWTSSEDINIRQHAFNIYCYSKNSYSDYKGNNSYVRLVRRIH